MTLPVVEAHEPFFRPDIDGNDNPSVHRDRVHPYLDRGRDEIVGDGLLDPLSSRFEIVHRLELTGLVDTYQ